MLINIDMKICILEAQKPPVACASICSHYGEFFQHLFSKQNETVDFSFYNIVDGFYPQKDEQFDCFIITGSRADSFSNDKWVVDLRAFVTEELAKGSKFIGICFGHQVLALVLGGKVERAKKGLGLGVQTYQIKPLPFMQPYLPELNFLVFHQDQVTHLPSNAQIYASNDFCPIGGFVVGNQILTLQAHPEYHKDYVLKLIELNKAYLNETQLQNFQTSIKKEIVDKSIIAKWFINFIKS
jgi:GMP synthase-like glutamine amidotransferase